MCTSYASNSMNIYTLTIGAQTMSEVCYLLRYRLAQPSYFKPTNIVLIKDYFFPYENEYLLVYNTTVVTIMC